MSARGFAIASSTSFVLAAAIAALLRLPGDALADGVIVETTGSRRC